jgi:hypothetical protein
MVFRQFQASRRIIARRLVFSYCLWQLMWWLCLSLGGGALPMPSFCLQGGMGYKESHRVSYNCSPSRTSLS